MSTTISATMQMTMDRKPMAMNSYTSGPPPYSNQKENESVTQSIRIFPKTLAWCLALTSGILLYGYDLVIVGNVSSMPEFQ